MEKEVIKEMLEDKLTELFCECQDQMGIKYGDISPDLAFALDGRVDEMVDMIHTVLEYQKGANLYVH